MPIISFGSDTPVVHPTAFIAPDAWIIGKVTIGPNVSIFFNAVLRGDIQPITVGAGSNIQEHSLLHTSHGLDPVTIGEDCTIGHRAIIHGCSIGDRCLIGMGATVLDNASIGNDCLVGAHALVTKNTIIAPSCLVMGTPAKTVRELTAEELLSLRESAEGYKKLGSTYREAFRTESR
jgi:carbonic anhydrase/acetyltransferase-like protein (isoleucine patch superfamily)